MPNLATILGLFLLLAATSCQEPSYRTEVTPNGEGGVEVHRLPLSAPSDGAMKLSTGGNAARTNASVAEHIRALEAQRAAIDQQIAKLKSQLRQTPATNP